MPSSGAVAKPSSLRQRRSWFCCVHVCVSGMRDDRGDGRVQNSLHALCGCGACSQNWTHVRTRLKMAATDHPLTYFHVYMYQTHVHQARQHAHASTGRMQHCTHGKTQFTRVKDTGACGEAVITEALPLSTNRSPPGGFRETNPACK